MGSEVGAAGRKAQTVGVEKVEAGDVQGIVAQVAGHSGPEADALGADGIGPEWDFTLNYTDRRGRLWTGGFKAHVLTTKDRMTVGLTKARLGMGIPYDMLDPTTANLLEVMAHLEVALDARPPWAGNLTAIYDQGVLAAIYEEVVKYEARFHGAGAANAG